MKLTVVGSSGSFPGPGNPASCYLVTAGATKVVLDLGNGALGALASYTSLDDVDAVLLSHLHADHCLDLCSYYVYRRYNPEGRRARLPVYGPVGVAARLARAYDLDPEPGMTGEYEFVEWADGRTVRIGELAVTVAQVVHPVPTFAMRLEHAGRVLVYSGDTAPSPALAELADGADVLLAEASFHEGRDETPGLHMTGRQAAATATKACVDRLVITHLPPWNDPERTLVEARSAWSGPLALAHPGDVIDV